METATLWFRVCFVTTSTNVTLPTVAASRYAQTMSGIFRVRVELCTC